MSAGIDVEKTSSPLTQPSFTNEGNIDVDQYSEQKEYFLDVRKIDFDISMKLASDGHTVLIHQPGHDSNISLNWNVFKTCLIMAVVCSCTFLPNYGSVTGAVTLIPQAT